ncbi:MAG: hypothetical protein IJ842_02420 [Bacilli bacterium]|nr:hypothetical protein [Bacilli bacterium]
MKKKRVVLLICIIQIAIFLGLLCIGYNIIKDNIKADKKEEKEDLSVIPKNDLQKEIESVIDSLSSEKYTLYLDLYSGKKEKHLIIYHSDNIEKIDVVLDNKNVSNYLDYSNKLYYENNDNNYSTKSVNNEPFIYYLKQLFDVYETVVHEEEHSYYTITFFDEPITKYVNSLSNLVYLGDFKLEHTDNNFNSFGLYEKVLFTGNNTGYQFDINVGEKEYMTITFTDVGLDNNISLPN